MAAQLSRSRKRELKELNTKAWEGEQDLFPTQPALDSSLKKNTAVIKRLRTSLTSENLQILLKEIATTSLEKYLSEVVSAVAEGLQKTRTALDIAAAIEVVSALHQRFQRSFTPQLTYALARGLATPRPDILKNFSLEQREKEEKERLVRQRALLRIAVELWLVGVIRTVDDAISVEESLIKTGAATKPSPNGMSPSVVKRKTNEDADLEPFPLEVLKDLLGRDREHINLPLVVLFVKSFSYDLLGVKPKGSVPRTLQEDGVLTGPQDGARREIGEDTVEPEVTTEERELPLVAPELQQRFRNVLERYLNSVQDHIVRQHKFLQEQSHRNAEAYIKSGEVFEDRQANYEKLVKAQEKFIANAQTVADMLGVEMPHLQDDKEGETGAGDMIVKDGVSMFASRTDEGRVGIWEDEDQKKFYEDLVDLKIRVPAILLEDGKRKKTFEGTNVEGEKHLTNKKTVEDESVHKSPSSAEPTPVAEAEDTEKSEDTSTAIQNKTIGAQVDALLIRLPDLTNRDLIDQAAIDFCFLNSKASRNRLLKVVQDVPRGRHDLLPYYARLVATLNRYMPDIGAGLVSYLDKEFRNLQKRKEKDLGEARMRNIKYLSELTKFGVVPQHVIFHCLKVALDDFSRINIDIICDVLENCGRYLLRTPETSPRMATFLETLYRKKTAQHLGPQEKILIDNAFYYVNPPERPAITQKERTPIELFVRKLIYLDLTKRNYVKILKQLRKLHWELSETHTMLLKVFSKVWKVRFNNIHILAILVGELGRYHSQFSIAVVDELLEQIELGLEQNNFKHNQRRIAQVKYLGELYIYKMIDSQVIFDTLYRITTFGHEGAVPRPGKVCLLDMPDDFFRIRLVCTLLDVCGMCFERGSAKKKLDFFLTFFQYYIHTKDPLPMDIEFIVQDTFQAIRPNWKLYSNIEDAAKAFEEATAKTYKSQRELEEVEQDESSDDGVDDDDQREDDQREDDQREDEEGQQTDDEAESQTVASAEQAAANTDSEEEIVVVRQEEQRDPEADAEFDRELAKLMSESIESRKFERKPVFDIPLPVKRNLTREPTMESEAGSEAAKNANTMAFSLLTKRGNRPQTRTVELPADSSFAVAMRSKQEAEREEQQRIKNLVLNYERMEETNELDPLEKYNTSKYDKAVQRSTQRKGRLSLALDDANW